MKESDITVKASDLYFLPIEMRVPLKFGRETSTHTTCARAKVTVEDRSGKTAEGWGETPLSVGWGWPSSLSFARREDGMKEFCRELSADWPIFGVSGHPVEVGHAYLGQRLPEILAAFNAETGAAMPWLAALICSSAFDLAVHDAFGNLLGKPTYDTYTGVYLNRDLSAYLKPAPHTTIDFSGKFPADFFEAPLPRSLRAWHLVGGLDKIEVSELSDEDPRDGYPILLEDWIGRDGLKCLKVKLRGNDSAWDYQRLVSVGRQGMEHGVEWLTCDFNCTVDEPQYVNEILDRIMREHPRIYGMILYVEQPFPYDLEANRIDVHSISARKPLFMDESAHDWEKVMLGRELGWTGVALKTCKTQTGALLSLCWAKAHGMGLMVQDLTNPMLAQIPHVLLAACAGTIMGVETNAMQFYPEASLPEAEIHPGLYTRRNGEVDLSTLGKTGFGYRVEEIRRTLPDPE